MMCGSRRISSAMPSRTASSQPVATRRSPAARRRQRLRRIDRLGADVVADVAGSGSGDLRANSSASSTIASILCLDLGEVSSASAMRVFLDQALAEKVRSDRASPRRRSPPACGRCRRPGRPRDGRRCGRSSPRSASARRRRRARSIASLAACQTASTSLPSTATPGMP